MKALGLNPYLPSWEFVPDGEPHVFDGRVYLYGSHDSRNGVSFCEGDYVVWSAPVDDLGNWRCEGYSVPVIGTSNKIQGRNTLEKGLRDAVLF